MLPTDPMRTVRKLRPLAAPGPRARLRSPTLLCIPAAAMLATLLPSAAPAADREMPEGVELEALQATVSEWRAGAAAADREPTATDGEAEEDIAPSASAGAPEPPPGASRHAPGEEATIVESASSEPAFRAHKRAPERAAAAAAGAGQASLGPTMQQISFASFSFTARRGVDERLLAAAEQVGASEDETYAFLLMDEPLTPDIERELESRGVTLLGRHDDALKVRLPLERSELQALSEMPFFHSLNYPLPEQKLAPELDAALAAFAGEIDRFPVIISLFDAEAARRAPRLEELGAELGEFDRTLNAYPALASAETIRAIAEQDFVLFIEVERLTGPGHDQSMPTNGIDYIRNSFTAAPLALGILDTGFMLGTAAATMHEDLNKNGCGINYTADAAGVWNDEHGHGTHVLGTVAGTGTADQRFRGVATGLGTEHRIRAAKIWNNANTGQGSWMRSAMDFMDDATACGSTRPQVVNISGGARGTGQRGTDAESRHLDSKVWEFRQTYVVCGGNSGPTAQSIWSPGVAKNALAVGNVRDNTALQVGELAADSSIGPAGDGRMKPNLVATGDVVSAPRAGTTNRYRNMSGCSMATPHVSGIVASLMQHYPEFRNRPQLVRAHLMSSAIQRRDQTVPANNTNGGRNDFGLGRVSDYQAHWAHFNPNGWRSRWAWHTVTDRNWAFFDVEVPRGTDRLVAVMTWDEPAASAGASRAVVNDLDLWIDFGADCTPDAKGQCGEWASQSDIDNTEYLIINNPPPGIYRLKTVNWRAPTSGVPAAIAVKIIEGDPTPVMSLTASPSSLTPPVGSTFTVTTTVRSPAYEAYGVHVSVPSVPSGLTLLGVQTTRKDGIAMDFGNARGLTLGSIIEGDSRSATWRFRVDTAGPKTVRFRAWSDNGGTRDQSVTINQIAAALSDIQSSPE
jgi:subtilisin family serine protease